MEKYRGPEDQHTKIERRYMTRLVVGTLIVAAGVLVTSLNVALSQTTVQVPAADPGAGVIEVRAPFNPNTTIGTIALLLGGVVNLYSISKYRSEYAEIREKEPRPEGQFVGVGLLMTFLALGLAGYLIFG